MREKGFFRESTAVLFKNHRGTLIKPPRYFLQSTAVVYLSEAGIDPKKGRGQTFFLGVFAQFDGQGRWVSWTTAAVLPRRNSKGRGRVPDPPIRSAAEVPRKKLQFFTKGG